MALIKSISGIRGTIGGKAGDGLSPVDVVKFTAAYATLIRKTTTRTSNLIVVGRDARLSGKMVDSLVTGTLCAMGFDVVNIGLASTPTTEIAVVGEGACGGIILTASHNPKEYNGYKAYWADGAQIIAPHDVNIINHVNRIKNVADIKFEGNPDLIQIIGKEVDDAFLSDIKGLSLSPEIIERHKDLKIVYTPIHGTGVKLVPQSLQNYGFTNIIHVPEQDIPDGNFPTVDSPNPENASAMAMAVAKALSLIHISEPTRRS